MDLWSLFVGLGMLVAGALFRRIRENHGRREGGYVVGVVRDTPWWIKIVHREPAGTVSEVEATLDRCAALVASGEIR